MKKFKIFDFWVSVGLIISFSIITIVEKDFAFGYNIDGSNSFIMGYTVVGLWQVVSMVVHLFKAKQMPLSYLRYFYTAISFLCLIAMPFGFFIFGLLLKIAAPMAIFYAGICGFEIYQRKHAI
jgi:hypothetical protein